MTITWTTGVGSTQSSYKLRYRPVFANPVATWEENTVTTTSDEITILPGEKYEVEVIALSGDQSSEAETANKVTRMCMVYI